MSVSLVRGRAVVTHAIDRNSWNEIAEGAVLQTDGLITEIGGFADLHARHPDVEVIGSGNEILLPGFINGHHHVGLTPFQLGSPDMPLAHLIHCRCESNHF
jgi:5-methylthioadenosine/S-adenosylhomocysteine deaminase